MKEHIEKFFRVGLVAAMAYPDDYASRADEVCLRIAKDDYFQAIELNPIADANVRARAARILEQSHLEVCYGAQARILGPGLNPNALDEAEREKAENTLMEALFEARELGSKAIAFLAGHWEISTREEALNQLVKTTTNVCRVAGEMGMSVEVEVFDYDIAKKSLIGPSALAARFAGMVLESCPNFGLLVDLSHIPMCCEKPADVIRRLKGYITHLHIGNTVCCNPQADAYGDEHPRFGYPESSNDTQQLVEFLRVLKDESFFRPQEPLTMSFEVKPRPGEDPDVVLASSKRVLNRAWALI